MIVLAGGSWGMGEWRKETPDAQSRITHRGLHQYLLDHQLDVINISEFGQSNWQTYQRISKLFSSGIAQHLKTPISTVFVFQVEWFKDVRHADSEKITIGHYDEHTAIQTMSTWYTQLSDLAVENSVKIGLIGSSSDTIFLDPFEKYYPGVFVACQSMTNLLINNDHRTHTPIHGILYQPIVEIFKGMTKDSRALEHLITASDNSMQRLDQWQSNPDWFFPDGLHANRHGHKKLFEFLLTNEYV